MAFPEFAPAAAYTLALPNGAAADRDPRRGRHRARRAPAGLCEGRFHGGVAVRPRPRPRERRSPTQYGIAARASTRSRRQLRLRRRTPSSTSRSCPTSSSRRWRRCPMARPCSSRNRSATPSRGSRAGRPVPSQAPDRGRQHPAAVRATGRGRSRTHRVRGDRRTHRPRDPDLGQYALGDVPVRLRHGAARDHHAQRALPRSGALVPRQPDRRECRHGRSSGQGPGEYQVGHHLPLRRPAAPCRRSRPTTTTTTAAGSRRASSSGRAPRAPSARSSGCCSTTRPADADALDYILRDELDAGGARSRSRARGFRTPSSARCPRSSGSSRDRSIRCRRALTTSSIPWPSWRRRTSPTTARASDPTMSTSSRRQA